MLLNFNELLDENLCNVYHVFGEDLFIIQEVCLEIEKKCNNNLGDLNKSIFDDENFDIDALLAVCEQIPMLAEKRFVLVKNLQKISEFALKKIIAYCEHPSNECVLVLCELPNQNIFKKVPAKQIECKKLPELKLRKFIESQLEKVNKSITIDACTLLINFCVQDVMLIKNELFKLSYYNKSFNNKDITKTNQLYNSNNNSSLNKNLNLNNLSVSNNNFENENNFGNDKIKNTKVIDCDDIKLLVVKNDDYSVFEISEALTKGNQNRAIILLKKMMETMDFNFILGLIASHFRRMYYSLISAGTDLEIAQQLGVKPFAITKAKSLAKHLKPMQISNINSLILKIDYMIKDGKMSVENAMYYLVFAISMIIKNNTFRIN